MGTYCTDTANRAVSNVSDTKPVFGYRSFANLLCYVATFVLITTWVN